MAFRLPTVIETLWALTLRNGNEQALELVTYSKRNSGLVVMEVREYIEPSLIHCTRGIEHLDARGWGIGMPKGQRADHWEWARDNAEQVTAAFRRAKMQDIGEGLDTLGRPLPLPNRRRT